MRTELEMKTKCTLAGTLLIAATTTLSVADTITVGPNFVDYDFITITAAISAASSGDVIVIEPDLYPENLVVTGGKDLTLQNAGGGDVIVLGQGLGKCFVSSGATTDVVLDGITFTNGSSASAGSGVSIEGSSSAIIMDCVIENNSGSGVGGGLYISGTATVMDTIIRGNTSTGNGGGVYLAGTTSKSFINCTFEDNTGVEGGGLAYASAGDTTELIACSFIGNHATARGGAIAVLGTTSSAGIVDVVDCVLDQNVADVAGGAVWISDQDVFHATNSVFSNNMAQADGGAIRNEQICEMVNCTFVGNDVVPVGVADTLHNARSDAVIYLLNSIVVNDSASSYSGAGILFTTYCLFPEGPSGMADSFGNFNADPMFADPMNGDYSLLAGSPAIDAGNSRGMLGSPSIGIIDVLDLDTDLAGNVRNLDDPDTANTGVSTWELCVDLGAYEYQPNPAPSCTADINMDGSLNFLDVSAFLSAFGDGCPE
jgi:parallel beta-helix repeat protein/predicted outer membrane repeat protein